MEDKGMLGNKHVFASEIDDSYACITDSQDILPILEDIGMESEYEDIGTLFVKVDNGDYASIYANPHLIVYNDSVCTRLL